MLWSMEKVRGFAIAARDGTLGRVQDFLFDDQSWRVRYLVVDTAWLFGRRVLIPVSALGHPSSQSEEFGVDLTREQVEKSPEIDAAKPLSREQETSIYSHYGWDPYWLAPVGGIPVVPPLATDTAARAEASAPSADREPAEPNLQSAHAVVGCSISASDGEIGSIADFLVDEDGWVLRYAVVDTGKWLPGRKVLITPNWIERVDWADRSVVVDLTRDKIKDSPEYNPESPVERNYERDLYGWYNRDSYF